MSDLNDPYPLDDMETSVRRFWSGVVVPGHTQPELSCRCEVVVEDLSLLPTYEGEGNAADLRASRDMSVMPGQVSVVPIGVRMAIPRGYVGLVCSRSGLAAKKRVFVLNAPGVVDSTYRGEVAVILANFGSEIFEVHTGDRIAQMLFVPSVHMEFAPTQDLPATSRGEGGFGSTGVR